MSESSNNSKDYFTELQTKLTDSRDNRGKKHHLAFVILSFFIAILSSSGKLNVSLIHRKMLSNKEFLRTIFDSEPTTVISYSQLKRVLSKVDYQSFNSINQEYFKKQICTEELLWQAIDGKELRGTIDKVVGQKRSENIVQQVSHQSKQSQLIGFYNGSKESEKTIVQDYFDTATDLQGKAYSFDALHTSAGLLESIEQKNGIYLMQVKENQKHLLEDCKNIHGNLQVKERFTTTEKGHGRIENRTGFLYPLNVECLDSRWYKSNIQSLVVVERTRYIVKTKVETKETAYFISNKKIEQNTGKELINAARQHWTIESDNHVRDVNFGEDEIICFNKNASRMMAISISLAINLLRPLNKNNNIKALREEISNNRNLISSCFSIN